MASTKSVKAGARLNTKDGIKIGETEYWDEFRDVNYGTGHSSESGYAESA